MGDYSGGGGGITPPAGDIGGTTSNPTVVDTHLSAPLPIAQGGTGSASQNFVDLSSAQTIGGTKTFGDAITVGSATSGSSIVASFGNATGNINLTVNGEGGVTLYQGTTDLSFNPNLNTISCNATFTTSLLITNSPNPSQPLTPVSGTGFQASTKSDTFVDCPITASAAGTVIIAISNDNVTYYTIATVSVPVGTQLYSRYLRAGQYLKLTTATGTITYGAVTVA